MSIKDPLAVELDLMTKVVETIKGMPVQRSGLIMVKMVGISQPIYR